MPQRLITVAYVSLVAAAGWAVNHASEARSIQKLRSLETACLRTGNPGRALDRVEARGADLHRREKFQPILDCHQTYFENEGFPVPLSLNQQRLYVFWIRRNVRPFIRADGTVTPK